MSELLAICRVCNGWSNNPCEFCGHDRNYVYRVLMADPPWPHDNKGNRAAPDYEDRRAGKHYETMSVTDLCAMGPNLIHPVNFEVPNGLRIADSAFLFLWATWSMVIEGHASAVANAWGFIPKTVVTWVKTNKNAKNGHAIGLGNYSRGVTEPMLICRRGKAQVVRHDMLNVIYADRRSHSEKPDEAYFYVEALTGADRFLEFFARRRYSERWICHGNQMERNAA